MKIIKVEDLVKKFDGITAVDKISFDVEERTIFGFLGPNGAGKTTTISILCTLIAPTSGKAFISDYDCFKNPSEVRKQIGIVFQDTTLDKDLTAHENLVFHAYLYKVPKSEIRQRVDDVLKFVELYDRKDDLVKKYSGGMKRRLEVARGLIHKPRVLFLDEPTLGLDPQSRANLWEFITELPKKHNVTVFMTTHYMEEAEVCDKIAIIDHGKIISIGSPEELKTIVGGDVVLIETTDNRISKTQIEGLFKLKVSEKDHYLYVTCDRGDTCIPEIIRTLGDKVKSVKIQRPTLNDVFLKLTGKTIRDDEEKTNGSILESIRKYKRSR